MAGSRVAAAVHLRVGGGGQPAVGREAHVVELHLVEALGDRFPGDRDEVVPDLLAKRIDPGELLVVDPGLAGARVDDREIRSMVGQDVVLEGDDARDGVDAALAERPEHAVEVLDDDRARARRPSSAAGTSVR